MPKNMKILKVVFALGFGSFIIYLLKLYGPRLSASSKTIDVVPTDDHAGIDEKPLTLPPDFASRIPSLPYAYWRNYRNNDQKMSPTCAKYPSIVDLEFNNIYWQTLRTSNGTFQLVGAYYDIRKSSPIGPAVRILGMIDRIEPTVETFCQFWFNDKKTPIIIKTLEYRYIWQKYWDNYRQGIYQPYLIACKIPKEFHGVELTSVSIVEKECDTATNNLRVIYNRPPHKTKKGFAVCVKGLDFLYDDQSLRLVEWIEMIKILGADKIYFYELQVHPNMSTILQHYEQEGLVHVTPLTLAGGQPNAPGLQQLYLSKRRNHKRQIEVIAYNDCLYKNIYMYDFIALLDIDEVIIPKNDMTWGELMERVLHKSRLGIYQSYNVRNAYFLHENLTLYEDIPHYMLMLQQVHRWQNYTEPEVNVNCFHNPERVLSLHNQFTLMCLEGRCQSYPIDTEDAQMQHYWDLNKNSIMFREHSVEDTTIWKYKDMLVRQTVRTLDRLGFNRSP